MRNGDAGYLNMYKRRIGEASGVRYGASNEEMMMVVQNMK